MQQLKKVSPFYILVGLYCFVGFLTVVNQQFQIPIQKSLLEHSASMQNALTTSIVLAFFIGFPLASSWSGKLINKRGYQFTLVTGLGILISSLVLIIISALLTPKMGTIHLTDNASIPGSYIIFLLASAVLGISMAFLHVVINPYLSSCDVKNTTSASRITLGSTANSVGTFIAPFFLSYLVFNSSAEISINQVIVPFTILALVIGVVSFLVTKMNLPCIEATKISSKNKDVKRVWKYRNLKFGVIAIFLYIGAEVAIGANISLYAKALDVTKYTIIPVVGVKMETIPLMIALYWGSILLVRLFACRLFKNITESKQLFYAALISALFILMAIVFDNVWWLVCVGFGHSIMWPVIFNLAIKNLGQYTTIGSGKLMLGMLGGAIIPWSQGILADVFNWQYTWFLIIACEFYLVWYAINGSKNKTENI
ncbi:MAG: MFS transporter [Carboxylicivirga sp.]|jgi:FHS family L-fucose permease-like MFS transporter|nr:MFS transporter [Carboxylicivirga sp.]